MTSTTTPRDVVIGETEFREIGAALYRAERSIAGLRDQVEGIARTLHLREPVPDAEYACVALDSVRRAIRAYDAARERAHMAQGGPHER